MSDGTAQSLNDANERGKRSKQSIWMSRWTRTTYHLTEEVRNHQTSKALVNKELDCITVKFHPRSGLESSRNDNLGTSPRNLRDEGLSCEYIPIATTHRGDLKSNPVPDGSQKIDPNDRWVKRLKLSTSDHPSHGTKISDMGERSFFRKIIKDNTISSEPALGNCHGKELMLSEKTGGLSRKGEFANVDPSKNDKDLLVSHAWIQRWLRKGSTLTKMKSKSLVEPRSSKLAGEKQFPSVAAMALMGRAMTCFPPCELQNRGSFVVWKTRAL